MPELDESSDQSLSLVERLARDGWTRIGSPGILRERDPKALFRAVKPQVAHERKRVGYRASSRASDSRRKPLPVPPRPPFTVVALAAA